MGWVLPAVQLGMAAGSAFLGSRGSSTPDYTRLGPTRNANVGNWNFTDPRFDYRENMYDPMYSNWYNAQYGPDATQLGQEGRDMWADMWGDRSRYQQQADHAYGYNAGDEQYYTPEERENMLRTYERYGAMTTPEEYAYMWMTPEEQMASSGDPFAALNRFYAGTQSMRNDMDFREQRSFDTLNEQDRNIRGIGDSYRTGAGRVLDSGATGLRDAAYASDLEMDPNYSGRQEGKLSGAGSTIRGGYNDPNILASDEFMQDYRFGPEDTQDLEHLAGTAVGTKYQAEVGDIERKAASSGAASPMALAAFRARANQEAAREGADAVVGARTKGRGLELETTRGREDVRLGAAQNRANLMTQAELNLLDQGLNEGRIAEQLRLSANQRRRGMQMDAEGNIMDANLGNERDQAAFNADNERYLGTSRLGTYSDIGNARQRFGEFESGTGAGLEQSADEIAARRLFDLAQNRQNTQRYTADNRYQQGRQTALDSAGINRDIANQRLQFNQERRGYLSGMQAGSQSGALTGMGQRQNLFSTRGQLAGSAANTMSQYDLGRRDRAARDFGLPSRFERGAAAGVGALAGFGQGGD